VKSHSSTVDRSPRESIEQEYTTYAGRGRLRLPNRHHPSKVARRHLPRSPGGQARTDHRSPEAGRAQTAAGRCAAPVQSRRRDSRGRSGAAKPAPVVVAQTHYQASTDTGHAAVRLPVAPAPPAFIIDDKGNKVIQMKPPVVVRDLAHRIGTKPHILLAN